MVNWWAPGPTEWPCLKNHDEHLLTNIPVFHILHTHALVYTCTPYPPPQTAPQFILECSLLDWRFDAYSISFLLLFFFFKALVISVAEDEERKENVIVYLDLWKCELCFNWSCFTLLWESQHHWPGAGQTLGSACGVQKHLKLSYLSTMSEWAPPAVSGPGRDSDFLLRVGQSSWRTGNCVFLVGCPYAQDYLVSFMSLGKKMWEELNSPNFKNLLFSWRW